MDTPIIAQYYRETEPKKRKQLLDQAIASGEDQEAMKSAVKSMRHGTKIPQMMAALLTVI